LWWLWGKRGLEQVKEGASASGVGDEHKGLKRGVITLRGEENRRNTTRDNIGPPLSCVQKKREP